MWVQRTLQMLMYIFLSTQLTECYKKGSLTYVIDNTLSMTDDIDQVKKNTDEITKIVFQQKTSIIKNMVLVTFNDPYAFHVISTENKDVFKTKIDALYVHNDYGNPDCPEMSMAGILLAIENSLPRSFIYVFTDADAKDYTKSNEVTKMCQQKQSQIVFVLTGFCWEFADPKFQVYYDIAAACPGLAFNIDKTDVNAIFEPIKDAIKGNKEMITSRTIPARETKDILFELTDDIEYATVTASGEDVTLSIGSEPTHNEQKLSWINNLKVLRLTNIVSGTYVATVYSTSITTINVFGRSDFSFEHGFSGLSPTSLKDTISHPIENVSTQLFVSVTDANHTVNILFLEILDMSEHVISTYDLKRISGDFYSTPSFTPPLTIFKIAISGKAVNTGKKIKRLSRFPITPQKADKFLAPKISGVASKSALKGTSTTIECTITEGTPAPLISWQFMANGKLEFVPIAGSDNELHIPNIDDDNGGSYKCVARNVVGKAEHITVFTVQVPPFITSSSSFVYKSIQGQDMELRIPCSATGHPKPIITWSVQQKTIQPSTKYSIEDGNLVIKNPTVEDSAVYVCTAKNDVGLDSASFQADIIRIPAITSDTSLVYKGIEGQDKVLRIPCRATGVPKPMITWTKQQEIIKTSAKYFFENGDLLIRNPSIDDTSTYVCTAKNEAGSVSASFQAEILRVPVITSDSSTVYKAVEIKDKVLRLPCKATGVPKPTIAWKLKQETIEPSTKYDFEDGDLLIKNPTAKDTSTYTCIARNEAGSVDASFQANILIVPVITSDSSIVYKSIEGQEKILKLPCKATGIPRPVIVWTRNQNIINPNTKYYFLNGDLVIKDPAVGDTSMYVCTARNEAGSVNASFRVEILHTPTITSDTSIVYQGIERKDKVLRLPCKATGPPKPTITWKLKQEIINPSTKYVYKDGDLLINNPTSDDTSTYTCIAKNEAGSVSASFQVKILVVPAITSDSSVVYKSIEGQEKILKLPCKATGIPRPVIVWTRNQNIINPNTKYYFLNGDLVIKDPAVGDTSMYVCTARNEAGSVSASFRVEILHTPTITSDTSIVYQGIERKDKVLRLPCKATGPPKPTITWKLKREIINPSTKYVYEDGDLLINNPTSDDTSTYTCIAKNEAGSVSASFQAKILVGPAITSDSSIVYKSIEGQGKMLKLPCKATGIPRPIIVWTRNQNIINPNTKYYYINGDLVIKDPAVGDTSMYVCTARNEAGSVSASFRVEILHTPTITSDSSIVYKAIEGKDKVLRLPCKATGVPKPTITWALKQEIINPSTKYVYKDGDLLIINPTSDDTSTYTCTAENEAGSVSASFETKILRIPAITSDSSTVFYSIEGQDKVLRLPCKATGIPTPVTTWARNHQIIKPRAKYNFVDGDLLIKDPTVDDTSAYVCTAVNEAGAVSASFQAEIHQKPQISGEITQTVRAATSTSIICIIMKGVPIPTITWQFMAKNMKNYVQLASTENILRLPSVTEKDDGHYKCLASNIAGHAEHTINLIVQVPPIITSDYSKPYTMIEGREKTFEIPCAATGFPKPIIKWIKINGPVEENDKYAFKDGDLIIKNPTVYDTATYFCVAKNDAGSVSATFHVEIYQSPEIEGETSKQVEIGTSTNIKCKIVKGVPAPTITWYKAKVGSSFVRVPGSTNTLLISPVSEEDVGRYKCIARNTVGYAIFITELEIKSRPEIINNHPEPYEGLKGDVALIIPCNTIGIPPPQISWSVNGIDITTSPRYSISGGALTIKDLKKTDTGSYQCEATNFVGSTHVVYDAIIKEDLDDYGDIEIMNINMLQPSLDKLVCGSPGQSVRWFIEKQDVNIIGNSFDLTDIDYEGNFTCRVSDIHGAYTKTYRISFGRPPKFQFEQEQTTFNWTGNDDDKLDCSVESGNNTQVEWTYNGKVLSDHTSFTLGVEAKWGLYTCNVSNDFGAIQRSFDVISTKCFMSSNPKEYGSMPLILDEKLTWPTLSYAENYFALNPGDKVTLICSKKIKDKNNFKVLPTLNEITAICEKQDTFIVNKKPYKATDLGCAYDVMPTVINNHKPCDQGLTEIIQVGFNVPNFLETYSVCFDKAINMPRYSSVMMPNINENVELNHKWYRHPAVKFRTDNGMYTCKDSTSKCCYRKSQLVSSKEVFKGPAQSTTFIDGLNAVPLWHPCGKDRSPWKDVEDKISERVLLSPVDSIWSGIHTLQHNSGHLIPRYLFKFVKFIDEVPIAIIYVNGPSPSVADILCKNICQDIFWLDNLDSEVYCCHGEDFRAVFNFNH